ncbi:PREDICTED: putative defensin-like protein 170, partial [Camelina sativa]
DCSGACKSKFGQDTISRCDRDGGKGTCICSYPCSTEKPHI